MSAEIVGLSFAIEPARGCYIPLGHRYAGAPAQLEPREVLAALAPWFGDAARAKLGQNLKYAQHALANHGIALRGVRARHRARVVRARIAQAARPRQPRARATWTCRRSATTTVTGKGARRISFEQVALDRATEYAAEDADVTLRLHRHAVAADRSATRSSSHIYATIELPVREVLFRMERDGVLVDSSVLAAQSRELGERVNALEQQAHRLAGTPFNLGSPKQLCEILFERMKLPVREEDGDRPAVHRRGSAAGARGRLSAAESAARVPRAREAQVDVHGQAAAMVNARTGRVHTTFSQTTAVTGRLASIEPNLQNIPGAHGRRPPHPRGVHRAAGTRAGLGRLFAGRAAHHGAPVGRSRAAARRSTKATTSIARRRRKSSAYRRRRSPPISAATSRPSISG